jgi:hypothetical protein
MYIFPDTVGEESEASDFFPTVLAENPALRIFPRAASGFCCTSKLLIAND